MESMERRCFPASLSPGGEIKGSMLIGLAQAFKSIQVITGDVATDMVDGIESTEWYPMASFFQMLDSICIEGVDYDPILFHAGVAVAEDWYTNGHGRDHAKSAVDFLRMQGRSGGYRSVHRGEPGEIGWMDLLELDEAAGRARIVCVTPYPKEFERGVLYGGTLMVGDVQFVDVESHEEAYNAHLSKKTLTIRFCKVPEEAAGRELDKVLAGMAPGEPIALAPSVQAALAWRFKGLEARYRVEQSFQRQSNLLLARAMRDIYELSQKLDELAHHDELTGLWNRRAILRRAETFLTLGVRHGWSTAFIMIDIDRFKTINDEWGHAVGDDALCLVAAVLRERLRDSDLLGRVGGEEFLVVLPNAGFEGALTVAESLRAEVEKQSLLSPRGKPIPLTVSLGIAVASGDESSSNIGDYIKQADEALYQSKREGRNRVSCYEQREGA